MAEKVTRMEIKVDLQCSRCYKKIKKILCQFPQIRDQIYNEKQKMVSITVVCCSPEKIRQMIICKGGETVESVEIKVDKTKEKEEPAKSKQKPLQPVPGSSAVKAPIPGVGYPPVPVYPMVGVCCCPPGYGGYGGGPCYCGRRRPVMCDDGCGRLACECRGGNRGYYVCRCDYFSDENATGCTVM